MANTRVQQQTLVDTNLPDNSTNLITPEKHREVETESISAAAFVDDDNTFTGDNEFQQPIIVGEATIAAAVGSSNFQAGASAGQDNTGTECVQVGGFAGQNNTGVSCNQIGDRAGNNNAGGNCVQIGQRSGKNNTGNFCIQVGEDAGQSNTGNEAIQIGKNAGQGNTKANGIFLGTSAGFDGTDGYTGSDDVFAIANASIPSFADKNAADAAITTGNGYPAGSTYLYRNDQHGWIGFVTL